MVAFVRFVMRDNGLALHVNAEQVTLVRQTIEGDPAIYISGRDTPMIVEGTLEAIVRQLEGSAADLTEIESFVEPAPVEAELPTAEPELDSPAAAAPEPEVKAPAKGKARVKAKKPGKAAAKTAPDMPFEAGAPSEPETPYPGAAWFRGNR